MTERLHVSKIVPNFFSGELDRIERESLLSHCEKCESCKQELYRQFWALVLEKGPDSVSFKPDFIYGDCFSPETLVAYAEGLLQPDEKKLVEEHLSHCEICQTELEVESSEWPEWFPSDKFESDIYPAGNLVRALGKGLQRIPQALRRLSEYPSVEFEIKGVLGETPFREGAVKEIPLHNWFGEVELKEHLPWAKPVIYIVRQVDEHDNSIANYMAYAKVCSAEIKGSLKVWLITDTGEYAEACLTQRFPAKALTGCALPSDWGKIIPWLFLEDDRDVET